MSWPDGRYIQAAVFFSRWLLAPFLLGLLLCLALLIYRFFADLFVLAIQVQSLNWHDLVTGVLNLVDLALTANLILIVIFSGFENFIRRIDAAAHPDWPEGLTQVDFGALKQKLLGSIVGIAAVDAWPGISISKSLPTRRSCFGCWASPWFSPWSCCSWRSPTGSATAGKRERKAGPGVGRPPRPGEGLLTIPGVNRTSA